MADLAQSLAFEAWTEEARGVDLLNYAAQRTTLRRAGAEWVGPCPSCGGEDRFSISLRKGTWHCRKAKDRGERSGGDVIALAMYVEACDFLRACEILTGRPAPGRDAHESEAERADRVARQTERAERAAAEVAREREVEFRHRLGERKRAHAFWEAAEKVIAGTPAGDYLRLRCLDCPAGAHLRFAAQHPFNHRDEAADGTVTFRRLHTGPALLAGMTGPDGLFAGVHQTWINLADRDGKLRLADPDTGEILPSRKVRGIKRGARIELIRREYPEILILGEGLETCLSVHQALRVAGDPLAAEAAVWASIDLGNLSGATPIPDSVRMLILLGDGDSDPELTRTALSRARARYDRPGRRVGIAWAEPGQDFNDMLRSAA